MISAWWLLLSPLVFMFGYIVSAILASGKCADMETDNIYLTEQNTNLVNENKKLNSHLARAGRLIESLQHENNVLNKMQSLRKVTTPTPSGSDKPSSGSELKSVG